jgi:nicotinate-nucleotide adenylyltransferase
MQTSGATDWPAARRRIGVFGGTFDPVHLGHLIAAAEALSSLELDVVTFLPAGQPPHKPAGSITAPEHRLAMLALALAGNRRLEISRVDLDRPGPHYTVDALEAIRRAEPAAELFFLVGADWLAELATWHRPRDLATLATLAVLGRPGFEVEVPALAVAVPGIADRLRAVEMPQIGVSASDLRDRVSAGRPVRYQLPDAVAEYIGRYSLYRGSGGQEVARPGDEASVRADEALGPGDEAPAAAVRAPGQPGEAPGGAMPILAATLNAGKLREIRQLLAGTPVDAVSPDDLGLRLDVAETGSIYAENALLKARAYVRASGMAVLAEDSGLEVDALDGAPGIRSSRWVAGSDADRLRALLDRLDGVPMADRTARYRAAALIMWPDGHLACGYGSVEGRIAVTQRGAGGFGYDPVFLVEDGGYGGHVTMAELPAAEKDRIGHRGRAIRRVAPALAEAGPTRARHL